MNIWRREDPYNRKRGLLRWTAGLLALTLLSACGGAPEHVAGAYMGSPSKTAADTGQPMPGANSLPPAQKTTLPVTSEQTSRTSDALDSIQVIDRQTVWVWGFAQGDLRLARTTDGGAHWEPVPHAPLQTDGGMGLPDPLVRFLDGHTGWMSWTNKQGMVVARTTDGGKTWQETMLAGSYVAKELCFVNNKEGWLLAAGSDVAMTAPQKKLFHTTDGGESWDPVASDAVPGQEAGNTEGLLPSQGFAAGVAFRSPSEGFLSVENRSGAAVLLYRTEDGGKTWRLLDVPPPSGISGGEWTSAPQSPFFAGDHVLVPILFTGKSASEYVLYRSANGGRTWSYEVIPPPVSSGTAGFWAAALPVFSSGPTVWVSDGQKLYRSADLGKSWLPPADLFAAGGADPATDRVRAFGYADTRIGWVLGAEKNKGVRLYKTEDGGLSWDRQTLPPAEAMAALSAQTVYRSLHMFTPDTGWASAGPGFHILRTTNGGDRWRDVSPQGLDGAGVAHFLDERTAWVAASSSGPDGRMVTVYRTTDGGSHWSRSSFGPGAEEGGVPYSLDFIDSRHGWLLLEPDHGANTSPGELYATADGGRTWTWIAGTSRPGSLPFGGAVAFLDEHRGWLAGSPAGTLPGRLYRTRDGGATWTEVELKAPEGAGEGTMNPGVPSFSRKEPGTGVLRAEWIPGDGSAKAYASYLYTTADGGETWNLSKPVKYEGLMDAVSPREAWAWSMAPADPDDATAPYTGTLYHTADGGQHWDALPADPALNELLTARIPVRQVDFADASHGWILAGNESVNRILRTTDGGKSWRIPSGTGTVE